MHRHLLILVLFLTLASCRQGDAVVNPPPGGGSPGAYIVCEGGFTGGASLSFYDAERDTLYRFVTAAESSWLFPNDMKLVGQKGYIAVSGSDRVDVLDAATHQVAASVTLPPGSGPGFLAASGSAVYAANYNGTVSRIDVSDDSLMKTSVRVCGFPGGIAVANGRVFVSDVGLFPAVGEWVKVLDPGTLEQVDSVRVGGSPAQMTLLGGRLFVVASAVSRVVAVHPSALAVEDSVQLAGFLSDITTDGQSLFVLGADSVSRLSPAPLRLEDGRFIGRSTGLYFYSLAADPASGNLYLGTVTGSGGSGVLEVFSTGGVRRSPAPRPVGVFPGAYAFR